MKIARKYAQAFLNTSDDTLSLEKVLRIVELGNFLRAHSRMLSLLQIPVISNEIKKNALVSLAQRFDVADVINPLLDVLLIARRGNLLADVCHMIGKYYQQRNAIYEITVSSAIPVSTDQKAVIEQFLASQVKGTIIYTYKEDPKLIAGIRIQGDTILWEYSINQQLQDLQRGRHA